MANIRHPGSNPVRTTFGGLITSQIRCGLQPTSSSFQGVCRSDPLGCSLLHECLRLSGRRADEVGTRSRRSRGAETGSTRSGTSCEMVSGFLAVRRDGFAPDLKEMQMVGELVSDGRDNVKGTQRTSLFP
jgi:hypothetical protein